MIVCFDPPWILYTSLTSRKQHICWLGKKSQKNFLCSNIHNMWLLLQIFWESHGICHSWNHSLTQEMVYLWGDFCALEALFPLIKGVCSCVWCRSSQIGSLACRGIFTVIFIAVIWMTNCCLRTILLVVFVHSNITTDFCGSLDVLPECNSIGGEPVSSDPFTYLYFRSIPTVCFEKGCI